MKVKGKIIIIFVAICLLVLSIVGVSVYISESAQIDKTTEANIEGSAAAKASDIADQYAIYEKIIDVVGHDERIYNQVYPSNMRAEVMTNYATTLGFTSGNVLNSQGVSIKDATDFSDRDYVQRALKGETVISSVSQSRLTGNWGYSIAGPLYDADENIIGVVYFRQEIDGLIDILSTVDLSDNAYGYVLDSEGTVIAHENLDLIDNESVVGDSAFDQMFVDIANGITSGSTEYTFDGKSMECGYSVIDHTDGWILVVTAPSSDFTESVNQLSKILIIVELIGIVAAVMASILLGNYIAKPIVRVKDNLELLAKGDFSGTIVAGKANTGNELVLLTNATASLQSSMKNLMQEANATLGSISKCDLSAPDMSRYPGEFNKMADSVNQIKGILNSMIRNIQEAIANVGTGAGEIADATTNLSQGTLAQANSIQQVVIEIENVANKTTENSKNEALVNNKLQHLDELIRTSNEQMTELRNAVQEIEEMSGDIQKIVSDIDSISFQTNILALNASVEAARAGEMGKGFAVVADEVGNLANKSSDSSKKTAELIEKCISSINKAKKCADDTFASLNDIVENSSEISKAFEEITSATEGQAENAGNIKAEMNKISDVVQTNTATAQETAASTQVLSGEADNLRTLISRFRV